MQIISTIARTGGRENYLVCDTFAGGKRFVTAIVLSADGGQHVSEIGQKTLDFARTYHHAQYGEGPAHLVQVFAASAARDKVLEVLGAADEGGLVVFFGRADGVCAALMKAVGLQGSGHA